jgi:hypothetical protein
MHFLKAGISNTEGPFPQASEECEWSQNDLKVFEACTWLLLDTGRYKQNIEREWQRVMN